MAGIIEGKKKKENVVFVNLAMLPPRQTAVDRSLFIPGTSISSLEEGPWVGG